MKTLGNELAQHLLEADEGDINARDFIFGRTPEQLAAQERKEIAAANRDAFFREHDKKYSTQRALGEVTPDTDASTFWHKTIKYADGRRAYQVRRNGATQRWVSKPDDFRIPIKIGYKGYGNIDQTNAHEYTTIEPPLVPKQLKLRGIK